MRHMRMLVTTCSVVLGGAGMAQHPEPPSGDADERDNQVGDGDGGYGYNDIQSENMEVLGWLPPSDFPGAGNNANDCWGYVSESGREYALLGLSRAFGFIEVTDPLRPSIVHVATGPGSTWRDIKVFGHHAYGVSEAALGVEIFDLSQIDSGIVTRVNQVFDDGPDSSHNVVIDEDSGFLYRVGGGGDDTGIRIFDLNDDPANPTYVGQWIGEGDVTLYVHDAQAVTYSGGEYDGREFVFACGIWSGDTRLWILDVTDKANIFLVSSVAYSGRAYAHQGWLSTDRSLFYLDDEADESRLGVPTSTHVTDVADLENPVDLGTFTNGNTAIDHNLYTTDKYIFEANYRSGLRVFDASTNPIQPVEVAWVDTYRLDDLPSTRGAWSNYPYLPSGTILISDRNQGLVLTRLTLDRIEIDLRLPEMIDPAGSVVDATITGVGLTPDIDSTRLFYEDAGGVVEIVPVPLGGDEYSFMLPASDCDQTTRIWLIAPSVEGASFSAPVRAPVEAFERPVATVAGTPFDDDFETDQGWSVSGDAISGFWERGVPVRAQLGDPPFDYDYSGQCFLTWNINEISDVDSGSVILTSPTIDASLGGTIEYAYWLNDTDEQRLTADDGLFVELSIDDGQTWIRVIDHRQPHGHWHLQSIDIDATVGASETLRVRFIAHDDDTPSVVEAGIDSVRYRGYACVYCPPDLDNDGDLDADDFFIYLDLFASGDEGADIDGDGDVDADDFFGYLDLFSAGC